MNTSLITRHPRVALVVVALLTLGSIEIACLGNSNATYSEQPSGETGTDTSAVDLPRPQTDYEYDSSGNLIRVLAPLERTTLQTWDALNRLKQRTDPADGGTHFEYDALGQLLSVTDPRRVTTRYDYNALGDLLTESSPETGTTTHAYDSAGNRRSTTDAAGRVASYQRDALNRITQVDYAQAGQPTRTHVFTWDQGVGQRGRLVRASDEHGDTRWEYDARGRVVRKQQRVGNVALAVEYAYDGFGRPVSLTYPSGRTVSYAYDAGQVSSVTVDGSSLVTGLTYFPWGPVRSWTWGNGRPYQRGLDGEGRLASYPLGDANRRVGFDLASRVTRYEHAGHASRDQSFEYDVMDRLTRFTGAGAPEETYGYDATGNRTHYTVAASRADYQSSMDSNRLVAIAGPTPKAYSYDDSGNVSADDAGVVFGYGARNRLERVTVGSITTTYSFNAAGERVKKAGGPTGTLAFAYDEQGRLIGEYDADGVARAEVVYLGNTPIGVLRTVETRVDDDAATFTGAWALVTDEVGFHGAGYRTHVADPTTADNVVWLPPSGGVSTYRVYARWTSGPDRASAATYTVTHAGGTSAVVVDQRVGGGAWNFLGSFAMAPDAGHQVRLSGAGNGVVVADAVKFVPSGAAPLYYVYADHLDTPRVITDASDRPRWQWLADPFGAAAADENPSGLGAFNFEWRFPGQYRDAESGLHYNSLRDYDSATGRYLQSDPIGLAGGLNRYAYVGGSPTSHTDSRGLAADEAGLPFGEISDELADELMEEALSGPTSGCDDVDDDPNVKAKFRGGAGPRSGPGARFKGMDPRHIIRESVPKITQVEIDAAERRYRTDKNFRDFFHRQNNRDTKVSSNEMRNPNQSGQAMLDALRAYEDEGAPKRESGLRKHRR